jgi:hypothetical protein
MDDGQHYRDQSSQPVCTLLRHQTESRESTRRSAKRSARRYPRRAPRPTSTPRRLRIPQFAKRLAQRGFR